MAHRRLGLCAALALVSACTAANPLYQPERLPDLGADLAGVDLAGVDLAHPPDLARSTTCMGDARSCDTGGSLQCSAGNFTVDRACPVMSTCTDGFCQPPPPTLGVIGRACILNDHISETVCFNGMGGNASCQPFITQGGAAVTWVCDTAIGKGTPGTDCSQGSECRSGFCGDNGTCFRACSSSQDCPSGGMGGGFVCETVAIVVEGHKISAKSCVPN